MIGTLDRHLAAQFLRAFAAVAAATAIVFVVLDVLLGYHLLARPAPSPWLKIELFAARVPALLNFALPLAALIAVLAVMVPMLRRGECIALGAAGLSMPRIARMLLLGALAVGVLDAVLALQVTPLATSRALALQDILERRAREGRVWEEGGVSWFAARVRVLDAAEPRLEGVVAARAGSILQADALRWTGAGWELPEGALLFSAAGGAQRLERLPPGPLPAALPLALAPDALFRRLLPRHTMSGGELLARGERADIAAFWGRLARLALPLLMALWALPTLVRFANRDRVAVATAEAALAALVPVAVLAAAALGADATPGHPALAIAAAVLLAALPAAWRWRRWRL